MKRMFQFYILGLLLAPACGCENARVATQVPAPASDRPTTFDNSPAPLDMKKTQAEVNAHYAKASPEIQEYVLWTASSFGRSGVGLWLNEDAFAALPDQEREKKVKYLAELFQTSEYGRHLCRGLAEAGALKDSRLIPGLMKVAAYHRDDADYDCRAKWMAVAALARQDGEDAVPLLISLADHGNQNTRDWARAALARKTGQDFKQDKQAWAAMWQAQGHKPLDQELLAPWKPAGK